MDSRTNLSIIIPNHNEKLIYEVVNWCEFYFPKSQIIVIDDRAGRGKGWALREGFNKSTKDIIVFIDGDMDISPSEIWKLLVENADIVVGKKILPKNFMRKMITFFSRKLIKLLFRLPISDTQTGLKMFKRNAISTWQENGFMCDIEILHNAYSRGFSIKEVFVNATTSKNKSIKQVVQCLLETICLWYRLSFLL